METREPDGGAPKIDVATAVVHVKAVVTEVDDSLLTRSMEQRAVPIHTQSGSSTPSVPAGRPEATGQSSDDRRDASSILAEAQALRILVEIRDRLDDINTQLAAYMELGG